MKLVRPYGRATVPTQLWLSPKGSRLHEVDAAILGPPVPAKPTQRLIDLKQWAINGQPSQQLLTFRNTAADARKITLEVALQTFVEQLYYGASDAFDSADELYLMLPAIRDAEARRNYRRLLERTALSVAGSNPVRFLFEPEMTLEFFRLVRRELRLRPDTNEVFLILDCGALTCNVTTVLTTKDGVSTGTSGFSRRGLNALPGSAANRAGRYVDQALLREAREQVQLPIHEDDALDLIEATKIETALTRRSTTLRDSTGRSWTLTLPRLEAMSEHLIAECIPTIKEVFERTYEQLRNSPRHREQLEASELRSAADLARSVGGIVLAGGTSQLPGFRGALWQALSLPEHTPAFLVGPEYPFVAAVGAMAHILERRGLLRAPLGQTPAESHSLAGSLQDDIYGVWRGKGKPNTFLLVDRDAWPASFFDDAKISLPPECRGKKVSLALVWGPDGHKKNEFLVSDTAKRWVEIDCSQTLPDLTLSAGHGGEELKLVTSGRKSKTCYYYVEMPRNEQRPSSNQHAPPDYADNALFAESTNTLVVDLGMSKTVLLSGQEGGVLDAQDFAVHSHEMRRSLELPPGWTLTPEHSTTDESRLSPAPPTSAPPAPSRGSVQTQASASQYTEDPDTPTLAQASEDVVHPPEEASEAALETSPSAETLSARRVVPLLPCGTHEQEKDFLGSALESARVATLDIDSADLLFLHLALSIRPLVLLAGAPGIGKTSLARFHAGLLGCSRAAQSLEFVPVQASWISDDPLLGATGTLVPFLEHGCSSEELLQAIILDEFNLTRPEYYLSRLVAAIEDSQAMPPSTMWSIPRFGRGEPRLILYATLNIDEASRPPADKILDRAFIVTPTSPNLVDILDHSRPPCTVPEKRVAAKQWIEWGRLSAPLSLPQDLRDIVQTIYNHEQSHNIPAHEAIIPTRRALHDLAALDQRFASAGGESLGVSRASILDRGVVGRILPRLKGDKRAITPLLDELIQKFQALGWTLSERAAQIMLMRTDYGFVSYWT